MRRRVARDRQILIEVAIAGMFLIGVAAYGRTPTSLGMTRSFGRGGSDWGVALVIFTALRIAMGRPTGFADAVLARTERRIAVTVR